MSTLTTRPYTAKIPLMTTGISDFIISSGANVPIPAIPIPLLAVPIAAPADDRINAAAHL
jgi:hypothetical protein